MDLFPHARRALLTAYADTDAAIQAINVVDLDHYLLKPWDPPEEKLYPVVDALIEMWLASDEEPVEPHPGRRAPLVGPLVRGPRLPGLQLGAVPLAHQRGARGAAAAVGGRGGRHRGPAGGDARRRSSRRAQHRRPGRPGRPVDDARHRLLRRRDRRWRAGRARRRRVRRVGGPAHGAGRAAGDRRAGRAELAHRELPRVPGRGQRNPAHRPGPPAGPQVRRRDPHHPRRRRPRRAAVVTSRPLRRRR